MEQKVIIIIPVYLVVQLTNSTARTMQRRDGCLYEKLELLFRISLSLSNTLYDSVTLLSFESLIYAVTCSTFRTVNNCFSHLMPTTS